MSGVRDCPELPPITLVFTVNGDLNLSSVDFFPQSLLYIFGDFHTFGPFPERLVLFQVSGTIYDA